LTKQIIEDLVILGRACPEPLKDGRVTVCLAGHSNTLGFVRLYPTRPDLDAHRWDIIKVEVERTERDTRKESWKIAGSNAEWDVLSERVEVVGKLKNVQQRKTLVASLTDDCINFLNDDKRSLGIIKPKVIHNTYLKDNPSYDTPFQMGFKFFTEFDDWKVKRDFEVEPHVVYTCPNCQTVGQKHDQQILEWGIYAWFLKEPDIKEQVWDNLGITDPSREIYFLVGNQFKYRNSFMVISVLRFPKGDVTLPMFPPPKLPPDSFGK